MAADKGYALAQFSYGNMCLNGIGVQRDLSQAARYFKLAADNGNPEAKHNYDLLQRMTLQSRLKVG